MKARERVIALLTDFGSRDTYVGVMKGVILGIAPGATLVDLSHEVAPQNVHEAAYALLTSHRYFPPGTVFCCVVDPGVGSSRRAVAVEMKADGADPKYAVCPDNGLLTPTLRQAPARSATLLDDPAYRLPQVSATFHGRDIFAPAAGHLAAGLPLGELGSPLDPGELVGLDWPEPEATERGWRAAVIHVDHFGNLITNLPGDQLEPPLERWLVEVGAVRIGGVSRTFADVAVSQNVAYLGSSGYLELAVRQGNAHRAWKVGAGASVNISRRG